MQKHITTPATVPGPDGTIAQPGYARTEVMQYTRENIRAPWYRIKEWDYYLFTNGRVGAAFTISDLGYLGMLSVSFLDFEKKTEHTRTELTVLPRGKRFGLGVSVADPYAECHTKNLDMVFSRKGNKRCISVDYRRFDGPKNLTAELIVTEPGPEAVYIATPWKKKPRAFYYNCKMNCLAADGEIMIGARRETFDRETATGVLDWGRGVWTYDNTWYWGTGSGRIGGKLFGFNLGYGFSDRSSASENAVFYEGKVHKLSEVTFQFRKDENGARDYMADWQITSDDGRFAGTFHPLLDRKAKTNAFVILSDQHQVFGRMTGKTVLDDGRRLVFRDFLCALEVVHNRY